MGQTITMRLLGGAGAFLALGAIGGGGTYWLAQVATEQTRALTQLVSRATPTPQTTSAENAVLQTLSQIVTLQAVIIFCTLISGKEVTDLVADIAAASQQQAQGIEQVNVAAGRLDAVTQSHSTQAQKLNATAQIMASQAEQLMALVRFFAVEDESSLRPDKLERHGQKAVAEIILPDREPVDAPIIGRVEPGLPV